MSHDRLCGFSHELFQKAQIVFAEHAQIANLVFQHGDALNA
jgi:hypothetical protein